MARRLFAGLRFVFALCVFEGAAGTETLVIGIAGRDVTLTCQNASQRALVVEWFQGDPDTAPVLFSSDGKLPEDARFSLVGNASLHITGLRPQDERNYTCKEVLNETDHLHRIQLLVASGPDRIDVHIQPTMVLPNGTFYAKRHGILNFTCTAISQPVPTIKWDFDPSGSPHELFTEVNGSQNSFILHQMSPRYQGNYTCSAKNPLSGFQETRTQELLVYCMYIKGGLQRVIVDAHGEFCSTAESETLCAQEGSVATPPRLSLPTQRGALRVKLHGLGNWCSVAELQARGTLKQFCS